MPTQSLPIVSYRAWRLPPIALVALAATLLLALLLTAAARASTPPEVEKLLASDGAAGDRFGAAVTIDGDTALVGAYRDDDACPSDPACDSGAAYVFQRQADGTWNQAAKLTADDGAAGDAFGAAVALSGDSVLVGAHGDGDKGASSGSAYVFQRGADGAWTQAAKLVPSDGGTGDWFGYAVALEDDIALVGAFLDSDSGTYSGSAYLFQRQVDGTWAETDKLEPPTGSAGSWFGYAVALSGDAALVGAPGDADSGPQSGSAYLFQRAADGDWTQVARLAASDGRVNSWFGTAVALDDDTALVGASGDAGNGIHAGAAYLFQSQADGAWAQQAKLLDSDGAAGDYFGEAVALSGDWALIGASGDNLPVPERSCYSGAAYLFQRQEDGDWLQAARMVAPDSAAGDWFGAQTALSSSSALIGSRGDDSACPADPYCDSGSAYMYELSTTGNGAPGAAGTDPSRP